jgi:hypothetical protein
LPTMPAPMMTALATESCCVTPLIHASLVAIRYIPT